MLGYMNFSKMFAIGRKKVAPIASLWSFERKTCEIKIVVVDICVGA